MAALPHSVFICLSALSHHDLPVWELADGSGGFMDVLYRVMPGVEASRNSDQKMKQKTKPKVPDRAPGTNEFQGSF